MSPCTRSPGRRQGGLTERETSHITIFDLGSSGQTEAAIAAVNKHLTAWPRDALVISIAANPNGLIGGSGRLGQKHQIAELMDSVAPHYGDDYWFLSYHAMALSEDGQLAEARPKIERSVARNPKNAHGATGLPMSATKAANWRPRGPFCCRGSPSIRAMASSTVT